MDEANSSLRPLEQALLQILMNCKVVESNVMEKHLERLRIDYQEQDLDLRVVDIFSRLNQKLKKLSLEIKTVVMRKTKNMIVEGEEVAEEEEEEGEEEEEEGGGGEEENAGREDANMDGIAASSSRRRTRAPVMINFHCIDNCSDDYASVQFGSTLSDVEFEALREMIGILGKYGIVFSHILLYALTHFFPAAYPIVEHGRIGAREIANIQVIKDKTKKGTLVDGLIKDKWLVRDSKGFFEIGPRSYVEIRDYIEGEMTRCNKDLTMFPQILFY